MSSFSFVRFLIVLLVLSPLMAKAQDLADVLSSIQERKRAVEQAAQVSVHLGSLFPGNPSPTIPDQVLIEWVGLGGVDFPGAGSLDSLSIEGRVALLNQAILEFGKLQGQYMNLRPGDLVQDAKIGAIRPYLREDFPELGRADATNYHALLYELANDVLRLRVRAWPFAGKKQTKHYEIDKWEAREDDGNGNEITVVHYGDNSQACEGWTPAVLGDGSVAAGDEGFWETSGEYSYDAISEDVGITTSYYSQFYLNDPDGSYSLRSLQATKTATYHSDAGLFASVPGRTDDQIGGRVVLLAANSWSPAAATDVTASASWNHADAAYVVVKDVTNATAPTTLGTAPEITVNLQWFDVGVWIPEDDAQMGLPSGFDELKSSFQGNEIVGSWENGMIAGDKVRVLERKLYALCAPAFTKGLDSGTKAGAMAQSAMTFRPPSGDAAPRLHPVPGLLAGVPLGVGIEGDSPGWIGISPVDYDFHQQHPHPVLASGIIYPDSVYTIPRVIRFDHASNLRFVGAAQDFHVVYATERTLAKRGADLPALSPTSAQNQTSGWNGQFFTAWDMPRLRQVVSRDFIVDVKPQGHFKNEVKVYRRPQSAGEVDRTPGHIETPDESQLLRTLVFSNPDATTGAYPAVAEKVHIADGTTLHEVWKDGLDVWSPNVVCHPLHFKTSNGTKEYFSKNIEFPEGLAAKVTTKVDGVTLSVDEITDTDWYLAAWNWWDYQSPAGVVRTAAGETITITNTLDDQTAGSQEGRYPDATTTEYSYQPDLTVEWRASGVIDLVSQEPWLLDVEPEGNGLKLSRKLNSSLVNTVTTEWNGLKVKTTTSADGSASPETAWSEVEYGNTGGTGLPGRPHLEKNSDGSGATYEWGWLAPSNSDQLTLTQGLLSGGTVSHGARSVQSVNERGHPTSSSSYLIHGGTVRTAGSSLANFTDWGMPQTSTDYNSNRDSIWTYDGKLSRPTSATSALGISTTLTNYDAVDRPGTVISNGIKSVNTYTAFSSSATISVGATGSITDSRDALGRLTNGSSTWNGVSDTAIPDRSSAGVLKITGTHTLFGDHRNDFNTGDGSLSFSKGDSQPFGGNDGTNLAVEGGLLKATARLLKSNGNPTDTFTTTWTDAWGRVRKTSAPTASGTGTTDYLYSDAASSLKRVCVNEPTGRKLITESDPYNSAGAITRSGIDVNGNGELGATDRYVESVTKVEGSDVVTILSLTEDSGLREILRTTWSPSGNVTVTKINGNEETITRHAPNYFTKTVKTTSTKGWERNESFNNLGLATGSALTGTGVPAATLTPAWRADGSLSGVTFSVGGDTHSATFKDDGTLDSLKVPADPAQFPGGREILGGHSISNGVEVLTLDGTTKTRRLDGTLETTSGGDVIGKTEELTIPTTGPAFNHATTPVVGAATNVTLNAAGAATAKNYAVGSGEAYGYQNGLLHTVSLARGGSLEFGYSNDSAKDLTSAVWPAVPSGVFGNIPAITEGYGHDRASRIDEIGDNSGARSLVYQNGRLKQTTWDSGALAGYKIVRGLDDYGRDTGFELWRGNTLIHSASKIPDGVSDQTLALTSGDLKVMPQRDTAGRGTGFQWGNKNGTFVPAVTQNWQRGTAGRILLANSTVSGSPSFDYKGTANNEATAFDGKGRRLKVKTAGADWTYIYTNGQLTNASHPTLGSFIYQFDGIGRRKNHAGSGNYADLLNRTMDWENSQNKTIKVVAHPDARVWVNGAEIPNFTGSHSYAVPTPGASGGWVPWTTLAVLEGEGDPGANPDAKSEQTGAVWVPPVNETLGYDAAGNRESSALWDYGWNAKNELVRARTKGYNDPAIAQGYDISFDYDAEGRRFKKTVKRYQNGAIAEQKVITFVWDGWDLLYERQQLPSGLTTLERKYLWGPDIAGGAAGGAGGLLLIRETKGDQTTDIYPLYDGTGHVAALTNSSGELLAEYAYGPFGERIHAKGPKAQSNPFRYATKYFDAETGLYYFGKRYLDPVTGQWFSREPLGESESLNLYSYCHNDPVNHVDVLGLASVLIDGGFSTSLDSIFGLLTDDFIPEPESTATIPEASSNKDLEWLAHFARYVKANELPMPAINFSFVHSIQRTPTHNQQRELAERENSPLYRFGDLLAGIVGLPGEVGAFAFNTVTMADITSAPLEYDLLGGGFHLGEERSRGERYAMAWLAVFPIGRGGSLVDDVVRSGIRTERGFSRGASISAWGIGVTDEVIDAANRLGNRYYARGHNVTSSTINGMGIVMRHDLGHLTVIGHRSTLDLVDLNAFSRNLYAWNPSMITLCVCRGADSPAASFLARDLGIPVVGNRFDIYFDYTTLGNGLRGIQHFAAEPSGWMLFSP
jgi:RHS repeat-associated protein